MIRRSRWLFSCVQRKPNLNGTFVEYTATKAPARFPIRQTVALFLQVHGMFVNFETCSCVLFVQPLLMLRPAIGGSLFHYRTKRPLLETVRISVSLTPPASGIGLFVETPGV
jgi:hypothetical protein